MRKIDVKYYSKEFRLERIHKDDSGYDLHAMIPEERVISIPPKEIRLIKTGIHLYLPKNTEGQIRSRSGLALQGLIVLNSPGTIDRGYIGEIKVILYNTSDTIHFKINHGDRIAQLIICQITPQNVIRIDSNELMESYSERGFLGFGSSGIKCTK